MAKELMKYEYKVASIHLIFPGDKDVTELDIQQVSSFNITKNFDSCFFPIFNLVLAVGPELAYKVMEFKNEVEVQLRVQYYRRDDVNSGVVGLNKDLFNIRFSVFIDDEEPNFDKKIIEETRKTTDADTGMSTMDFSSTLDLYLFKKQDMQASKKKVNIIAKDVDMCTLTTFLCAQSGVTSLCLEEFDNLKKYKQVVIPPFNLLNSLRYLESQYGFYKTWSNVFFDFNRMYVTSKRGRVNAQVGNEIKKCTLTIGSDDEKEFYNGGMFLQGNQYFINIPKDGIKFANPAALSDATMGNDMISIDAQSGDIHENKANTSQVNTGNVRIFVNRYDNPFLRDCETHRVNESNRVVAITLSDYDESFFRPNVEFIFKFTDNSLNKERGGLYRLVSTRSNYELNGSGYVVTGTFTFKQQR